MSMELSPLIMDLALILIAAGVMTLVFKRFKQPLVLGYIVAGLLISGYLAGYLPENIGQYIPSISDSENIAVWADIGVIFLLFGLGLEFSFKKLMKVGGTASITAVTEVVSMLVIGFAIGYLMGWNYMDSLFLGSMLALSSTTIIIKAFEDLKLRGQKFTNVVFGVLVVEDLIAILMMVLLPAIVLAQSSLGIELIESVGKMVFFLVLVFIAGIYILPTVFKYIRKYMNDETLLIVGIGLCLGMVVLSVEAHFSSALGAFIMGSILAETIDGEKIEHVTKPIKDLFGAVFFVSVGMMLDPQVLVDYAGPIVIITLATILGKAFFSSFGVLISGQNLKVSMQSGFSLAQIGEFAFIIAALGLSLKVTSDFLYPVVIAVSVITTFTSPYMIKYSDRAYEAFNKILPARARDFLNNYGSGSKTINKDNTWKKVLKTNIFVVVIYGILLAAIALLSVMYLSPFIKGHIGGWQGSLISVVITLLVMAPFLSALLMSKLKTKNFETLWNDPTFKKGYLVSLMLVRFIIAALVVSYVIFIEFTSKAGMIAVFVIFAISFALWSKTLQKQYTKFEDRFMQNLNERSVSKLKTEADVSALENIHMDTFEVTPTSPVIGKTLAELDFRRKYGVNVVSIIRGDQRYNIPGGSVRIYAWDKIIVLGTDEQMDAFGREIEDHSLEPEKKDETEVILQQFVVEDNSPLLGKPLCDCAIRDKSECLVVGVERDEEIIMNPDGKFVFHEGDIVSVVGEKEKVRNLCCVIT
ncbi:Glutathione-regulated potassium-efflux system protein KefB [Methanimicrococcus sp. At1]|uniref:Glutathione-regulated potassium-efflux system protein KefB n=1 Tax=Methanimicrococcus hacksteinii TaxID=3028293 RepID=A0ABU3VR62_9EURY|nr:cation:proton antiporter [Methanimicrococcus sp. At1]MDV0445902.1 Glutathione-regulated potassium-efflux system protein KefB [Methanimicrococcus sp. At1]